MLTRGLGQEKHYERKNMYCVDVPVRELRFDDHAQGRPFHAALLRLRPRTPDIGLHGHADYYELFHVLEGHGRHYVAGGVQPLAAGDVAFLRPGDHHALASTPSDGMVWVNVAFSAASWRAYTELVGVPRLTEWDQAPQPPLFHVAGGRLRTSFERALHAFDRRPSMLDVVRLWTDVVAVTEQLDTDQVHMGNEQTRPVWLSRAFAAMQSEENMSGGLGRLVELCNVSPAHLARSVRRFYGRTPTELVTDIRLNHAAHLLVTTTEPVTAVAHRCGFSSQSYFSRCFDAAKGCSPRAFRERARRAFVP